MSFGQGVSVTPLAMARYYCAIANGGLLVQPRIVNAVYDQQGKLVQRYPTKIPRRVFSRQTAAELRQFLRSVVLHGTGDPTAQIPGYATAGKTGTAQMVVDGEYRSGFYAASFIGMVPYPRPRYVIYVKVERPLGSYYGSVVAAPAFAEIARAAMLHAGVLPSAVAHMDAERRVALAALLHTLPSARVRGDTQQSITRHRDRLRAPSQPGFALRRGARHADRRSSLSSPTP